MVLEILPDFHQFIATKINSGDSVRSPEEILKEWRLVHSNSRKLNDDIEAIQEALDDIEYGDEGVLFEQFDIEFRSTHHLPR